MRPGRITKRCLTRDGRAKKLEAPTQPLFQCTPRGCERRRAADDDHLGALAGRNPVARCVCLDELFYSFVFRVIELLQNIQLKRSAVQATVAVQPELAQSGKIPNPTRSPSSGWEASLRSGSPLVKGDVSSAWHIQNRRSGRALSKALSQYVPLTVSAPQPTGNRPDFAPLADDDIVCILVIRSILPLGELLRVAQHHSCLAQLRYESRRRNPARHDSEVHSHWDPPPTSRAIKVLRERNPIRRQPLPRPTPCSDRHQRSEAGGTPGDRRGSGQGCCIPRGCRRRGRRRGPGR